MELNNRNKNGIEVKMKKFTQPTTTITTTIKSNQQAVKVLYMLFDKFMCKSIYVLNGAAERGRENWKSKREREIGSMGEKEMEIKLRV